MAGKYLGPLRLETKGDFSARYAGIARQQMGRMLNFMRGAGLKQYVWRKNYGYVVIETLAVLPMVFSARVLTDVKELTVGVPCNRLHGFVDNGIMYPSNGDPPFTGAPDYYPSVNSPRVAINPYDQNNRTFCFPGYALYTRGNLWNNDPFPGDWFYFDTDGVAWIIDVTSQRTYTELIVSLVLVKKFDHVNLNLNSSIPMLNRVLDTVTLQLEDLRDDEDYAYGYASDYSVGPSSYPSADGKEAFINIIGSEQGVAIATLRALLEATISGKGEAGISGTIQTKYLLANLNTFYSETYFNSNPAGGAGSGSLVCESDFQPCATTDVQNSYLYLRGRCPLYFAKTPQGDVEVYFDSQVNVEGTYTFTRSMYVDPNTGACWGGWESVTASTLESWETSIVAERVSGASASEKLTFTKNRIDAPLRLGYFFLWPDYRRRGSYGVSAIYPTPHGALPLPPNFEDYHYLTPLMDKKIDPSPFWEYHPVLRTWYESTGAGTGYV